MNGSIKFGSGDRLLDLRGRSPEPKTYNLCKCGCILDRDENAAINILKKGLSTVGHTGSKAWGESASTVIEAILSQQVVSVNQESTRL